MKALAKPFFVPGGIILLAALVVFHWQSVMLSASAVNFYYAAVFISGLLLAWRFHSSRVMFWLVVLLLGERALLFFSAGQVWATASGRSAFRAIALLLPLNSIVVSLVRERRLTASTAGARAGLLFLESIYVALVSRPDYASVLGLSALSLLNPQWFQWTRIPQLSLLAFLAALVVSGTQFLTYRKAMEAGLLWSLLAVFLAFEQGGVGYAATFYLATAGLIMTASLIESSYVMAYHDELTGLPGRRAFNEYLAMVKDPYAIAIVDIDHFKRFNDTYGHDAGDQVLRLVARCLAQVSGQGKAYRLGGEEFSIVFVGKSAGEALKHLQSLRQQVAESRFKVRRQPDRRSIPRGPDRRAKAKKSPRASARFPRTAGCEVSVTVSIGVAAPSAKNRNVDQVIRAADKALYRAKESGRNRVEIDAQRQTRGGSTNTRR